MRVAVHQPQYWPWPPYIHKVLSADTFVYLDTVQYQKNGLQNRNQIRGPNGAQWLTLPVRAHLGQSIRETAIAQPRAAEKHFRTLQANYARAPGFVRWRDELEALLCREHASLADLAIASTEWLLEKVGATGRRLKSSELDVKEEERSRRLAAICAELGADVYLTGTGALAYLDESDLEQVECAVEVQRWTPFEYGQGRTDGFIADLSTLDLVLHQPDDARRLIDQAGSWAPVATIGAHE